ncbi:MAG TPA: hypothetical protein VGD37_29360, partial [Kofleriaceae bacterium]
MAEAGGSPVLRGPGVSGGGILPGPARSAAIGLCAEASCTDADDCFCVSYTAAPPMTATPLTSATTAILAVSTLP